MYVSVIVRHKRGSFALFHLFGRTSGLFQVFLGFPGSSQAFLNCYSLFQMIPVVTNDDFTKRFDLQITKDELYVRYCYKVRYCYYTMGSFLLYKTGHVVLRSRAGLTEWGNFYYKMEEGIAKWDNHYKVE